MKPYLNLTLFYLNFYFCASRIISRLYILLCTLDSLIYINNIGPLIPTVSNVSDKKFNNQYLRSQVQKQRPQLAEQESVVERNKYTKLAYFESLRKVRGLRCNLPKSLRDLYNPYNPREFPRNFALFAKKQK